MASATGFTLTPLGPRRRDPAGLRRRSAASLLAALILHERLSLQPRRSASPSSSSGCACSAPMRCARSAQQGVIGDLIFVSAGVAWAVFGTLLRRWRIEGHARRGHGRCDSRFSSTRRCTPSCSASTRMVAAGLWENLLQVAGQGFAGAFAIFMFTRAVDAARRRPRRRIRRAGARTSRWRSASWRSARCRPLCSSSASSS